MRFSVKNHKIAKLICSKVTIIRFLISLISNFALIRSKKIDNISFQLQNDTDTFRKNPTHIIT